MKRLGVFAISVILIITGYLSPSKTLAVITDADLERLQTHATTFSSINNGLGSRFSSMVVSVYGRFKDDPDVNETQFRRYVFEGVPGTTIPDQQGYIPYLNQIINNPASNPTLVRDARRLLAQSRELVNNAITNELLAGGSITQEQANAQINQNAQASGAAQGAALQNTETPKQTCSLFPPNIPACIDEGFTWLIKNTLLQIAGFLVWLTANMMNYAVQTGILGFSAWAPDSLYPLWIVVRQIVSLAIVFAGLYLGFLYIIGREDTFGRYIGWVIIFALFVNFSYPITRSIIDVSNIISLNIYSSAIGPEALAGSPNATAGGIIMNKLGLQGLVASATNVASDQSRIISNISTTPGALIAVVFVLYAAYIFFMATAILAIRTAVLVFLVIASPLMLVDAVVPKLGEVAARMRKMYFEQLVVAPVFMIMLALTLKFMDIFQASGAFSNAGSLSALSGAGTDSIKTFFGIFMMLIMLHIMLKVTRSLAGEAGNYATSFMGKVGGFGLAAATGGAGILARGTIGQAAMRARDSGWMDRMKDTRMGRGLYGLSNSLAKSTYDGRNIGMVSRGMATAGLTGGLGLTMQGGAKRGFEQAQKDRETKVLKFGSNIKEDRARDSYFAKTNKGFVYSKVDEAKLREASRSEHDKKISAVAAFIGADKSKRTSLIDQTSDDKPLQDKLRMANEYLAIDAVKDPEGIKKKVDTLIKLNDSDMAKKIIDTDPFADIQAKYNKEIEKEEADLEMADRKKEISITGADGVVKKTTEYEMKRKALAEKKASLKKDIEDKRAELLQEYRNRMNEITHGPVDVELPEGGGKDNNDDLVSKNGGGPQSPSGSGGSDMTRYEGAQYKIPAYQRKENTNFPPKPTSPPDEGNDMSPVTPANKPSGPHQSNGEATDAANAPRFQMDAVQLMQFREKMRALKNSGAPQA